MDYKITYSLENGSLRARLFSGESEGEAIEAFDFWAEGFNQVLQFEDIEEVQS